MLLMTATPRSDPPTTSGRDLRPLILVVDDEKAQRDLLGAVLESTFRVDIAESVAEAVVKAELTAPSLVIMDYAMPAVSGIEGLKRLRQINPDMPVVILTGHAELEVARQAIQLGAVEYILKPFEPADLISLVRRCTQQAGDQPPSARTETPYSLQRRLAGSVDLWRSKLPSVTSANHLWATLESGRSIEAKVLRLGHNSAQAEIYDPSFWMEGGQKVPVLQLWVNGEQAYHGSAELGGVITTGPTSICEFLLPEGWISGPEIPRFSHRDLAEELAQDFSRGRQQRPKLKTSFRVAVADAAMLLAELRDWLAGVEARHPAMIQGDDRCAIEAIFGRVAPLISEVFGAFEKESASIPDDLVGVYAEHVRTVLHPLVLCAPFVHRCFTKPLRYPGDFGIMNYMLGDPFQGTSLYARIVNAWVIRSGTCETYRQRVRHLEGVLDAEAARVAAEEGRPLRVLSLGSGAAPEVQSFLRNSPGSERSHFILLDFNATTVAYAQNQVAAANREAGRGAVIEVLEFSAQQMLTHGTRLLAGQKVDRVGFIKRGAYDVVYCAGLFDYLSDRVCQRLTEIFWNLAASGGAVVASNFSMPNPMRAFMDYVVDWRLIHRPEPAVRLMAPWEAEGSIETEFSPTGSEVFLHLRKPLAAALTQATGTEVMCPPTWPIGLADQNVRIHAGEMI